MMDTITRDFINRSPQVQIEPDAEYTCTNCHRRHKVSESEPAASKDFSARVAVKCRTCRRVLILVPSF